MGDKLVNVWFNILSICLWVTMYTTPLIMIFPELNESWRNMLMAVEVGWVLDIARRLFFNASDGEDPYVVAVDYAKGQFIWDAVATLPQVVSFLDQKYVFLKVLRVIQISLTLFPIETLLNLVITNRDQLFMSALRTAIRTSCYIMILLHYLGCLWIFIGSEYFADFEEDAEPWGFADDFKDMDKF